MARDAKSVVFEYMFDSRWDESTQTIPDPLFTLDDVLAAIEACNANDGKNRSTKNPANFFKDYTRKRRTANQRWPQRIRDAGFTAVQRTGGGQSFEFVPLEDGKDPFPIVGDWEVAERILVQSLRMPLISKSLGRSDEAWLTQVAVKLNFIESYFALSSSSRNIVEIDHLQMNAKLGPSEIDSVYRYVEEIDGDVQQGLILLEAKGISEDVSHDQLINSLKAGESMLSGDLKFLMSMALKVVKRSTVQVLEFEVVHQPNIQSTTALELQHEAVIEVHPPVPGI